MSSSRMANPFYSGLRLNQTRPVLQSARDNTRGHAGTGHSPISSSTPISHGGLETDQQDLLAACHDLKNQNNGLLILQAKMNKEIQLLRKETQDARKEAQEVREMVIKNKESEIQKGSKSDKLPKDLTKKVRMLHREQQPLDQFKGKERFSSVHNRRVATSLYTQLKEHIRNDSENLKFNENQINRAIRRHHETKRKGYLDSLPARQEQVSKNKEKAKRKQLRMRLYCRRFKAVRTEEEQTAWLQLSEAYMTEESDDEAEGVVRRHRLSWESNELQELKATLDERINDASTITGRFRSKPRVDSTVSTLPPPVQPVLWAVSQDIEQIEEDGHVGDEDSFNSSGSGSSQILSDGADMLTGDLPTFEDSELQPTPPRPGISSASTPRRYSRITGMRMVDMITNTPNRNTASATRL